MCICVFVGKSQGPHTFPAYKYTRHILLIHERGVMFFDIWLNLRLLAPSLSGIPLISKQVFFSRAKNPDARFPQTFASRRARANLSDQAGGGADRLGEISAQYTQRSVRSAYSQKPPVQNLNKRRSWSRARRS